MSGRVLCTSLNARTGPHLAILKEAGFEPVIPPPSANFYDAATLVESLRGCVACIAGSETYSPETIRSLPGLRVISRTGVGYDAVNLAACDEAGIVVAVTPGVNHHSVAEHALALLLGIARGFPLLDQKVRKGNWTRKAWPRIAGTTLGIVGLGRIGQALATRAVGIGMKVVAFEPFPNPEFCQKYSIEILGFDDLLARSDYVSLHAPMLPENHHLINEKSISRMKEGAVLINTARGQLVDEAALYEALKSGRLRGAGLDVFEVEPLPVDSPLLTLDNIFLSGHVAGQDVESQRDTATMVADTIVQLSRGEWPADRIVNLRGVQGWKW